MQPLNLPILAKRDLQIGSNFTLTSGYPVGLCNPFKRVLLRFYWDDKSGLYIQHFSGVFAREIMICYCTCSAMLYR